MKNLFILLCIGLVSCQTAVTNVEIPAIDEKVVVFGSASNYRNWTTIQVSKSEPLLNNNTNGEFEALVDAVVVLQGPNGNDTFEYVPFQNLFINKSPLDFIPGEVYNLSVKAPNFDEAIATTTMPLAPTNVDVEIDSIQGEWEVEYRLELTFDDDDSKEDFYRIEGVVDEFGDTISLYTFPYVFNDKLENRGRLTLNTVFYNWTGKSPIILLSAISEEEYKYEKALEGYEPGNPFAEPSPLPNNVSPGLGMFTLKNTQIVIL